jgi:putative membrane protein
MVGVASLLSPADRDAVTAAVTAAEAGTDGEIVTVIAAQSDAYHDVALHYAVLAMLLVTTAAALHPALLARGGGWGSEAELSFGTLLIAQVVAFLLIRFALRWTPLRLALTPRATKARRVRRAAVRCFRLSAEQRTAAREGVLLYLSTAEHLAEIVADHAVHHAVPAERWGEAMAALVDEVRAGRPGAGMAAAVGRIGAILSENFPKTADDRNELPDRLIEL